MKTKYFTILSMSAICLWLGLLGVLEGLRSYPKYCSYNRFAGHDGIGNNIDC